MGFAAVDIGNTSIKICRWDKNLHWNSTASTVADALKECGEHENVAYCSTRSLAESDLLLIKEAGWWEFRYGVKLPIKIDYATPQTLGADRMAGAVGASEKYEGRSVLIADVGTALTLDVVTSDKVFRGGNISPGSEMRLRALHYYTSKLPLVGSIGYDSYFGKDTDTAIAAGVKWGIVNEIAGSFNMAKKEFECDMLVLTGGGAPFFKKDVRRLLGNDIPVEFDSSLVEEGLRIAYNYNHER